MGGAGHRQILSSRCLENTEQEFHKIFRLFKAVLALLLPSNTQIEEYYPEYFNFSFPERTKNRRH